MDVSGNIVISKLTIIFPPGDQLTSILIEKEKDTKLEDLINRLCALRAIDLSKLQKVKILDDEGKKVDLSKTVGESNLPFIEISDKSTKKEQKKNKEESHKTRERLSSVKLTVTKNCYVPLEDQLFDDEKAALCVAKQFEVAKYFSDEYIIATLFAKKFDMKRTEEFLKSCLAWRKEKGFMNLPRFSEIDPRSFESNSFLPCSRDKSGRSIRYFNPGKVIPNVNGYTVENLTKWFVWMSYVGVFHEGIDGLRNGVCMVVDFEGYGWKNFDIDFQKHTSALFSEKFPLLVRKILIVNPPTIFTAVAKILSTMIKNKMFDRHEIVSVKDVGKFIDSDNLLAQFGGNVNYTRQDWCKNLAEWAERCEERLIAPGRE